MTQPTNIEKTIEAAREKYINPTLGMGEITNADLDEIVTSTYLQAVEDCEKLLKEEIEPCDEYEVGYFTCELYKKLQSLKQTKGDNGEKM